MPIAALSVPSSRASPSKTSLVITGSSVTYTQETVPARIASVTTARASRCPARWRRPSSSSRCMRPAAAPGGRSRTTRPGVRIRSVKTTISRQSTAKARKAPPAPVSSSRMPASSGPTTRETLPSLESIAIAFTSWLRGTSNAM